MIKFRLLQVFYLFMSFGVIFALLITGAAQLLTFFKTGAERGDIVLLPTEQVNDFYQPKVIWDKKRVNEGRPMEKGTLSKITKDYVAANYYQLQSLSTGDLNGLDDYYTLTLRAHLKQLVKENRENNKTFLGTEIEHHLRLRFYSADGTLITFEDDVIHYHETGIKEKEPWAFYDTVSYEVMMLLEDNFWRIRHKVRKPGSSKWEFSSPQKSIKNRAHVQDASLMVEGKPFTIKGMNYYPQDYPWLEMWENFDSLHLKEDFDFIRETGFNTLRVFLPYSLFGGPQVSGELLSKFRFMLDQAEKADLKVIVTLFDFFLGYEVTEWSLSDRHLEQVVTALSDHPALIAWDIKNEPDLDFDRIGEREVIQWLEFIAKRLRYYDAYTPITIGWSQPERASLLMDQLDFLSFHFYRDPVELRAFLRHPDQNHLFTKPLFLGETGMHSFHAWWFPFGKTEDEQYEFYDQVLAITKEHQLDYAVWTLYDFSEVPGNVAGKLPWKKKPQQAYGLINHQGEAKRSFDLLKAFNSTSYNFIENAHKPKSRDRNAVPAE